MDCGFLWQMKQIRRFWKQSGSWTSCAVWCGYWIVPVLMFKSWVLNEIWIVDLSSALVGMLMSSSSKLFLFSNEASGFRLLLELYYVKVSKHIAFFYNYYLGEIYTGIHIYHFTSELLHNIFCFRMWFWFRISTKNLADRRIWRKQCTDRRICIPLFTPFH